MLAPWLLARNSCLQPHHRPQPPPSKCQSLLNRLPSSQSVSALLSTPPPLPPRRRTRRDLSHVFPNPADQTLCGCFTKQLEPAQPNPSPPNPAWSRSERPSPWAGKASSHSVCFLWQLLRVKLWLHRGEDNNSGSQQPAALPWGGKMRGAPTINWPAMVASPSAAVWCGHSEPFKVSKLLCHAIWIIFSDIIWSNLSEHAALRRWLVWDAIQARAGMLLSSGVIDCSYQSTGSTAALHQIAPRSQDKA